MMNPKTGEYVVDEKATASTRKKVKKMREREAAAKAAAAKAAKQPFLAKAAQPDPKNDMGFDLDQHLATVKATGSKKKKSGLLSTDEANEDEPLKPSFGRKLKKLEKETGKASSGAAPTIVRQKSTSSS